jgi:spermidine/putrescine transport system permease protein
MTGWLLLAPLLGWLLLFVIIPTLLLVAASFFKTDIYNQIKFEFTLENYQRVADPTYLRIILKSLWYAFITAMLCLVMGFPVAFFIGRAPERYRNLLIMLVMIPFWTSFLIRTYAWFQILATKGLLNALLLGGGIIQTPLNLQYTEFSVILGLVYNYLPFMILPIFGSVEKLDGALIEAAYDLGASPRKAFARVVFPLTMPGITAGFLLVFVPALGMFAITTLMGGGNILMIGNVIQNQFLGQARNMAFGCALGTLLLALFMIAMWISYARKQPD